VPPYGFGDGMAGARVIVYAVKPLEPPWRRYRKR